MEEQDKVSLTEIQRYVKRIERHRAALNKALSDARDYGMDIYLDPDDDSNGYVRFSSLAMDFKDKEVLP